MKDEREVLITSGEASERSEEILQKSKVLSKALCRVLEEHGEDQSVHATSLAYAMAAVVYTWTSKRGQGRVVRGVLLEAMRSLAERAADTIEDDVAEDAAAGTPEAN